MGANYDIYIWMQRTDQYSLVYDDTEGRGRNKTSQPVFITKDTSISKSVQREGLVIPVSNLHRDTILELEKDDKMTSSNIRQRKTGQSEQEYPSIEMSTTGKNHEQSGWGTEVRAE